MEEAAISELLKNNPRLSSVREALTNLKVGTYCIHRAWGIGCVKSLDEAAGKLVISFEGSEGEHPMDIAFCATKLEILPDDHIIARHRREPAEIQSMIDSDPARLFTEILSGAKDQTMSVIEMETLLERLIGPNFKKWLTSAKKKLAKNNLITFPAKKTESYILHNEAVAADDELLVGFYKTKNAKKKIHLAEELALKGKDLPEEVRAKLDEVVKELSDAIAESRVLTAGERLQGVLVRADLAKTAGVDDTAFALQASSIISEAFSLTELAEEVPSQYQGRFLELVKTTYPEDWKKRSFDLLKNSSGRFTQECVSFLLDNNADQELTDTLERWLGEQSLKAPVLYWVIKNRTSRRYSTMLDRLIGPKLFSAIFYAIDYEAIQNASAKRIPLVDLLVEDKELIPELLATATPEVAHDLAHTLLMNQGFETLTKRSLIARFIKQFPDVQDLITTGEATAERDALIVSWESLERQRNEYHDLVTKKIPENKQAIAIAREHGDLSENSEYKMARQDQDTLMALKTKMESELRVARGTDFSDTTADQVGIGSIVTVTTKDGKTTYTILGAWDGNPDKNILSYKTPLAQALLGKKVGDSVEAAGISYKVEGFKRYFDTLPVKA